MYFERILMLSPETDPDKGKNVSVFVGEWFGSKTWFQYSHMLAKDKWLQERMRISHHLQH